MAKVFITGVSGTGKTTIARALEERGIPAFSVDEMEDMCWWIRKDNGEVVEEEIEEFTADFVENHRYICRIDVIKDILDKHDTCAVLGVVDGQNDFLHWFDKVLVLQCSPETFISRINERTDNDYGKTQDVQERICAWQPIFEKDLLERGAIPINVEKSIDEVVERVVQEIQSPE